MDAFWLSLNLSIYRPPVKFTSYREAAAVGPVPCRAIWCQSLFRFCPEWDCSECHGQLHNRWQFAVSRRFSKREGNRCWTINKSEKRAKIHGNRGIPYFSITHSGQIFLAKSFIVAPLLDELADLQGNFIVLQLFVLAIELGGILGNDMLLVSSGSDWNTNILDIW